MNVIDRARELIERDGWMQVTYGDNSAPGSACLTNAVLRVCTGDDGIDAKAHNTALDAIKAELGVQDIHDVWDFNDDPNTGLEDVLLLLKRASARLDEAGS